jgi:tRNA(Ile)-lysidine synthase
LRYHVSVHSLAHRVLSQIRQQDTLHPGDRVGIAVSGGIDSVALLRLLLELRHELGIVLSVIHFNHKLRGAESEADHEFVAGLARGHGLEFYCSSADVAELAAEQHSGLEAAAREMRYGFFRQLLSEGISMAEASLDSQLNRSAGKPALSLPKGAAPPNNILDKIVTGHTLDDQAETVLMRVIRGTGLRGLGGIYPRFVVQNKDDENEHDEDDDSHGEIVRPLLAIRRRELQGYLIEIKQAWREDATNADSRFTRNRLRKLVLPLLEREFNPAVAENLSELAEIARDEEDYWENEVSGWMGTVVQWSQPEWIAGLPGFAGPQPLVQILPSFSKAADPHENEVLQRVEEAGHAVANATVSRAWLVTEPKAVQRRLIKAIGEHAGIPFEFKHIEQILHFAAEDKAGKELSLPLGWKVVREPESIVFLTPDLRSSEVVCDYEYSLGVPGRVLVPELGVVIEALRVASDSELAEYNPQQLLDARLLGERLTVRNWRAGDRYWPAHTKAPKKIKELLQERHITQPARKMWPVGVSGDEIVWMRGFPVPAKCRLAQKGEGVLIREIPIDEHESG